MNITKLRREIENLPVHQDTCGPGAPDFLDRAEVLALIDQVPKREVLALLDKLPTADDPSLADIQEQLNNMDRRIIDLEKYKETHNAWHGAERATEGKR